MRKLLISCVLGLSLAACAPLALLSSGPAPVAQSTVLDEKVAISVELAYQAAGEAGLLLYKLGKVDVAKLKAAENKAYAAVLVVRRAYRAGNAADYATSANLAIGAIGEMLAIIRGG